MSAWPYLSSVVISIVVSAGTYMAMHHVMDPSLAVQHVDVPQLMGLLPDQARGLTEPLGLSLIIDGQREPDGDKPGTGNVPTAGTLFDQRPLQGSRLRRGSEVHATLALPITKVAVPGLAGQPLAAAQKALSEAGLRPGTVSEVLNPGIAPGAVVGSDPPAGAQLRRGEAVALQVSKASEQVAVPSLRGKGLGSARQLLEQAGLSLGDVRKGSDDNAGDGVILRQDPPAGTAVAKGHKVNIVVND